MQHTGDTSINEQVLFSRKPVSGEPVGGIMDKMGMKDRDLA